MSDVILFLSHVTTIFPSVSERAHPKNLFFPKFASSGTLVDKINRPFCSHVRLCVCVFTMCVHVHCAGACACMYLWKPGVDVGCPHLVSTCFDRISHWPISSVIHPDCLPVQQSSGIPHSASSVMGLKAGSSVPGFLHVCWSPNLGIQVTIVSTLAIEPSPRLLLP